MNIYGFLWILLMILDIYGNFWKYMEYLEFQPENYAF